MHECMLKRQASQVAVVVKNPPANTEDLGDAGSIPGSGRSPGRGNGNPLQYFPGESHGQRSLAGYSLQGRTESDMTEVTEHAHMLKCENQCWNS